MRRGGIEPVRARDDEPSVDRRIWLGLALVLLVAGAGVALYRATTVTLEETPPLRPLEPAELSAYLERDQISVGPLAGLFAVSETGDWPTEPEAASAAISAKSSPWSLDHPLPRKVYSADETLGALRAREARVELYPLEAAVALTALLRASGKDAMVAEVWDLGEQAPPDPSGLYGYFVSAVLAEDAQTPSAVYDPWGGRGSVDPVSFRVLRDTEVVAAALGANAMRAFMGAGDAGEALDAIDKALALDPTSPSLRGVHGTVLLETGGVSSGEEELEAALQLRDDGPRQLNVLQLAMAKAAMLQMAGEQGAAEAALGTASDSLHAVIEQTPGYARAHLMLATLHFALEDAESARNALEVAQQLDPKAASLWVLWGQYYVSQREPDAAMLRARRAVELDPDNWQLRLQVARVLLMAGDDSGAQEQVRAALDLVPASNRSELRRYLADALGPGVLGDDAAVAPPSAPGDLVLPPPTVGGVPASPSASDDPTLMLGDPSKLKLRDPDQDLRLDLDD